MRGTEERVKLTRYSHGAGCACKLGLADLREVLDHLGPQDAVSADVLVGLDEADDAAVVRLSEDDALVLTVDFFTPVVDDAFTWGRIAAANAASDVYAMGGTPLVALNITAWPSADLPLELLARVLAGGRAVARDGGFAIVGGHTVDDPEPKYGLVVVGRVHPRRLMTIDAARPGDVLVLTKPVGTGVITTAVKADAAPPAALDAAVASMTRLNAAAASVLTRAGVRACTDVTGFGLAGHLHRMLAASGVAARLDPSAVPVLDGARDLAAAGHVPGGTRRNADAVSEAVSWNGTGDVDRVLLCDAQTSGGLLAACPPEAVHDVVAGLEGELAASVVGTITDGPPGAVVIGPA